MSEPAGIPPASRRAASQRAGGGGGNTALQDALAAENAAVFGYGVVGAHLAGQPRAQAERDWVVHENDRDTLTAMLIARGAQPVAAAAAYDLPFPVRDARSAVQLAAYMEDRVTAAYLGLVAAPGAGPRAFGARKVRAAALRAASWRGRGLAFPGMEPPGPAVRAAGATPSKKP